MCCIQPSLKAQSAEITIISDMAISTETQLNKQQKVVVDLTTKVALLDSENAGKVPSE